MGFPSDGMKCKYLFYIYYLIGALGGDGVNPRVGELVLKRRLSVMNNVAFRADALNVYDLLEAHPVIGVVPAHADALDGTHRRHLLPPGIWRTDYLLISEGAQTQGDAAPVAPVTDTYELHFVCFFHC
jgi:hypothetical protein